MVAFLGFDCNICKFPYEYAGEIQNSCTLMGSEYWCIIDDARNWVECQGQTCDPSTTAIQPVIDITPKTNINQYFDCGKCQFPFEYGGEMHKSCTMADHTENWCITDEDRNWIDCNGQTCGEPVETTSSSSDFDCGKCLFPFNYDGRDHNSCINTDNNEYWCFTDNARPTPNWMTCGGKTCEMPTTTMMTTTIESSYFDCKSCIFPFEYDGKVHNSCIDADNTEYWCFIDNARPARNWVTCRGQTCSSTATTTIKPEEHTSSGSFGKPKT
jgi:hypothetical protein